MTIDELVKVKSSAELTSTLGDFGARIKNGKLLLPSEVYEVLIGDDENKLEYAYEIVCVFENKSYDFKAEVAGALGWSREEIEAAYEKLFRQTYHSIPENILKWTGIEEDARRLRERDNKN